MMKFKRLSIYTIYIVSAIFVPLAVWYFVDNTWGFVAGMAIWSILAFVDNPVVAFGGALVGGILSVVLMLALGEKIFEEGMLIPLVALSCSGAFLAVILSCRRKQNSNQKIE